MIGGETDGEKPGRIFVRSPRFLKMHTLKTKISDFKKNLPAIKFDLVVGLNSTTLSPLYSTLARERD